MMSPGASDTPADLVEVRRLPEARLGSRFAKVHAAFAPLLAFQESYASHLFEGTAVETPPGLALACEAFAIELASLHVELLAEAALLPETAAGRLVRLRVETDAFCGSHAAALAELAGSAPPDPTLLEAASEAGLFAGIYALSERLDEAFTEVFDGIETEEARWAFAVSFACRALIERPAIVRLSEELPGILFGGSDRDRPPFPTPSAIAESMTELAALAGRDLSPEEVDRAEALAATIHAHFVGDL